MPEMPDVTLYIERARERVLGQVLRQVRVLNPFVLRTAVPPLASVEGRRVLDIQRLGKRIVFALDGAPGEAPLYVVVHLMIAGRLRWLDPNAKPPGKLALAVFVFDGGQLVLTEAGTTRRASIHVVQGEAALQAMDPGGIDVMAIDFAAFDARLRRANHTLKRALTMPQLFSGIGNAYSDEILHRARLSPLALTQALPEADARRLYDAIRAVMAEWIERLRAENPGWPEKVTAFHPAMAVHGKYGQPCPVCAAPVQRIVQGDNELNYCARCQTGGRLLADRALSRLLKASWPKTIDELS
jgi:formamidopyrimidine-DNA glycosylase